MHLEHFTINIPDMLIAKELKKALPIDITPESSHLKGNFVITDIYSINIKNNNIYIDIALKGKNIHVITRIGNKDIGLELGSMAFHLQGKVALRFDSKDKTIFIRPFINSVQSSNKGQQETAKLLLPLINDVEFPVSVGQLKPVTADTRSKQINIFMDIADIQLIPGAIKIYIAPNLVSTNKQ